MPTVDDTPFSRGEDVPPSVADFAPGEAPAEIVAREAAVADLEQKLAALKAEDRAQVEARAEAISASVAALAAEAEKAAKAESPKSADIQLGPTDVAG